MIISLSGFIQLLLSLHVRPHHHHLHYMSQAYHQFQFQVLHFHIEVYSLQEFLWESTQAMV